MKEGYPLKAFGAIGTVHQQLLASLMATNKYAFIQELHFTIMYSRQYKVVFMVGSYLSKYILLKL